jgi:hypothetical protein
MNDVQVVFVLDRLDESQQFLPAICSTTIFHQFHFKESPLPLFILTVKVTRFLSADSFLVKGRFPKKAN